MLSFFVICQAAAAAPIRERTEAPVGRSPVRPDFSPVAQLHDAKEVIEICIQHAEVLHVIMSAYGWQVIFLPNRLRRKHQQTFPACQQNLYIVLPARCASGSLCDCCHRTENTRYTAPLTSARCNTPSPTAYSECFSFRGRHRPQRQHYRPLHAFQRTTFCVVWLRVQHGGPC